jgi:hypothetical protein
MGPLNVCSRCGQLLSSLRGPDSLAPAGFLAPTLESLAHIYEAWGIHRSHPRALSAHPDGRPWDYRALVPHVRVQPYERNKAPHALVDSNAGNAGAFGQLLQRHRSLADRLRREFEAGKVVLQHGVKPLFYVCLLRTDLETLRNTCELRMLGLQE